ncbi:superoxide dismutase family protein [Xanthomonas campestris pv. raphani]|uniref:superoxide dismutase family protein n=1 Tax=Xanthomonas campestris TaxID=339 RepID=UPI00021AF32F|nr:superoxide dismutase family protein [Xanthomonas campestris]MEB2181889.1 superoxide dismutase family protein [Xanthomonas campestris pv. campestris]AEL09193.1 copper-zinc superoxide dismutase [Xanthomonas campestris pv. raphani 756C]MEA9777154.1 superoxide dismutase family protein [Xanthomonas campestris pv. raphani]MEA9882982.1 superoxide dismutase family protein [Xanthomonas campestris pv. raphani]MEA9917494.1 superoxide dismutase family protein [Xanthomonas campestris pv. raphani]
MRYRSSTVVALTALALAACSSTPPAPPPPPPVPARVVPVRAVQQAEAPLASASGSLVSGRVVLVPALRGIRLTGTVGGLRPGAVAGFHVHERGDCSAADASSAGGHFNPTGAAHGRAGNGTHHLGDMDNLRADAEGVAHLDMILSDITLGDAAPSDVLGKALIVHADADDYRSQPSGNAGARLACGVIRATKWQTPPSQP